MFKLQTTNGVDHFLEACSREERDEWAADIAAAIDMLQMDKSEKVTNQQSGTGARSQNIDLR